MKQKTHIFFDQIGYDLVRKKVWQHLGRVKFEASGGVCGFRHSSVCSISDWQHKKKNLIIITFFFPFFTYSDRRFFCFFLFCAIHIFKDARAKLGILSIPS
jgi:hypothetical protein